MKIFGLYFGGEKSFIHITCNIILTVTLLVVISLSIFTPAISLAWQNGNGAYYSGDKNSNKVCLMINVYWGTEYLDSMLQTLKDNNIKTTFFVGGTWVAQNNNYLIRIKEEGHEIANHGYNHKDSVKISSAVCKSEIYDCHNLVKEVASIEMNLFAPPSGSVNERVVNIASSLGYKTIMWTRDTIDWRDKDSDIIYTRATLKTEGGDLILMHPTEATARALPRIIKALFDKNLTITTVTETLSNS